jgi:hypothetical protein
LISQIVDPEAGFLFEILLITHATLAMQLAAGSDRKYAQHMGHVAVTGLVRTWPRGAK